MSEYQKKQYTMEDNVKYISFGIKDLVKKLDEINVNLFNLVQALQKKGDEKDLSF